MAVRTLPATVDAVTDYRIYYAALGIPALIDHENNDFTIWESAAIIQYLVDRYDKDHKLSFPIGTDEYYVVQQWVAFQISGQVRR